MAKTIFKVGETAVQKLFGDSAGLYDTLAEITEIDFDEQVIVATLKADVPRTGYFSLEGLRYDGQAMLHKQ